MVGWSFGVGGRWVWKVGFFCGGLVGFGLA